MNDDDKPLTRKDLMEALGELEVLKERVYETEVRILKSPGRLSAPLEMRLSCLEDFAAAAGKRIANLEAYQLVAQIEKKLDRRQ